MKRTTLLLALLLPAFGTGCVMARVAPDPSEIALGELAPSFRLTSSSGEVVDSAALQADGEALMVVFYRTRW
jgi:hypothetical protein